MSDWSLIAILENASDEYTPEALAIAREEATTRGGIEFLKEKIFRLHPGTIDTVRQGKVPTEIPGQSNEILDRLKRFYHVIVLAAYIVFELIIGGSLWFYWLCVFVMIAFWVRVLIRARRLTPEEEYADIAREIARYPEKNDQTLNEEKP